MKRMEYADIKALLSPLIDGELDPETMLAVERTLAECDKSRALVNEAEALNDLIARDAVDLGGADNALPAGFADAVLNQTVRTEYVAPTPYFRQWTTWSGWFAAAACLALAVTIYVRNATPTNPGMSSDESIAMNDDALDAIRPGDASSFTNAPSLTQFAGLFQTHNGLQPVGHPLIESGAEVTTIEVDDTIQVDPAEQFFSGADLRHMQSAFTLSSPDVQTLDQVARLMDTIAHLDLNDDHAIAAMRSQIADQQLVPRLEEVRDHLQHLDQTPVYSAESILRTLIDEDTDVDALQRTRTDVQQMELPTQIRQISDRVSARLDL